MSAAAAVDAGELLHELRLADARPDVLELVAGLVDGSAGLDFSGNTTAELGAAWRRLEALPLPSGQHLFLDEILPALEGHRLLLVALSCTTAAA